MIQLHKIIKFNKIFNNIFNVTNILRVQLYDFKVFTDERK